MVKLCKDCQYYSRSFSVHPHNCAFKVDPINGGPGAFADIERQGSVDLPGYCGPSGRNFVQKAPGKKWWRIHG